MKIQSISNVIQSLCSLPTSAGAATYYLSDLLRRARLMDLFQTVDPQQFRRFGQSAMRSDEDFVEAASALVGVMGNRFPVYEIEIEEAEWAGRYIPICPAGLDWEQGDTGGADALVLLLLWLERRIEWSGELPAQYHALEGIGRADSERLAELCAHKNAPLDALALAYQWIHHETGNVWLDVAESWMHEGMEPPEWSRETVEWLTEEWQVAEGHLKRIRALDKWLRRDVQRAGQIAGLMKQAAIQPPRVQVRAGVWQSVPLSELMGEWNQQEEV